MSGKWTQACNGWETTNTAETAAMLISRILWNTMYGSTCNNVSDIVKAGSCIRTWRKSLPEQGERIHDYGSWHHDQDLLWWAMMRISEAREPAYSSQTRAFHLRHAEALLRTWWKRHQEI